VILIWGLFPTIVPIYLWEEQILRAFFGNWFRYVMTLHQVFYMFYKFIKTNKSKICSKLLLSLKAWLVNSAAHIFGNRPFDNRIEPRENLLVVYLSLGEGYHNYHHTFPVR
jgi:stearoyl-CoA desaturase (delta-9 desaturase)